MIVVRDEVAVTTPEEALASPSDVVKSEVAVTTPDTALTKGKAVVREEVAVSEAEFELDSSEVVVRVEDAVQVAVPDEAREVSTAGALPACASANRRVRRNHSHEGRKTPAISAYGRTRGRSEGYLRVP